MKKAFSPSAIKHEPISLNSSVAMSIVTPPPASPTLLPQGEGRELPLPPGEGWGEGKRLMGTSKNSFVGRIVSLHRARNPHVPGRTLRLLRALRLTLHPQKQIFRGALTCAGFGAGFVSATEDLRISLIAAYGRLC